MRSYTVIIGSVSFFDETIAQRGVSGCEFNDAVMLHDASRNTGYCFEPVDSLIVRNNHYHGIVESAHARLGGLIEDLTEDNADIFIHNPTSILLRYIRREKEAAHCECNEIVEPRSGLQGTEDVLSGIDSIRREIIGQNVALDEIGKTLWYLSNMQRCRPYVLMLYGKSSLGKTETAKAIANKFFRGKMLEKHFSMFEDYSLPNYDYLFGGKPNVNSLGFELNERESNLVFFDEMDKCGKVFHSAFYSLFDSPTYIDTTYEVDIKDILIILTCNYLSEEEIRRNLGDPIYYRIDKCIEFTDFEPSDLLEILNLEVERQLSAIRLPIDQEEVRRRAARDIPLIGSNGRTVQAVVRATIEDMLYKLL